MYKKSIFVFAIVTCIVSSVFTSCKSNSDKEEDAIENVQEAKENLEEVKVDINNDAITKANDAEWQTYKAEANKTISENEARIIELKKAMNKAGTTFDATYKKNIETLKDRNEALKLKILDYENNQTDWASFKREFNSDMTDLGNALKNLTVNNKK
jgi:DNA polymerase II small subunit/DNA polymerase delta subunit B